MGQNTSSAVMQQRREAPDSLDYFPSPPWAARALCEHVLIGGGERRDTLAAQRCWEPACGEGHLARGLADYFGAVHQSDCHDYGAGQPGFMTHDFLMPGAALFRADWIITNPPFRLAAEFVERALAQARQGAAMLVRMSFLEGGDRYRRLFAPTKAPPAIVAPFAERVPMFKGICRDPAVKYFDAQSGKWKTPSSATAYCCWLVWSKHPHHAGRTTVRWIPPCRKKLERPGDYDG